MLPVRVNGLDLRAEMVDDCAHHIVVEKQGDGLVVRVEHAKGFFGEAADRKTLRPLYGGLVQDSRDIKNAIDAEDGNFRMLIRPADHIIMVAVPSQGEGAEDIGLSIVFELSLLVFVIMEIAEAHFSVPVDGGIQSVRDFIDPLISRLDAVGEGGVPLEVGLFADWSQGDQLLGKILALLLGDELARFDGVDQELQFGGFEEPGSVIIAVLRGLDDRNVMAGLLQGGDIALHGDAEGRNLPTFLQGLFYLNDGDGMLLIGFILKNLKGPQQANSSFFIGHYRHLPSENIKIPHLISYYTMKARIWQEEIQSF